MIVACTFPCLFCGQTTAWPQQQQFQAPLLAPPIALSLWWCILCSVATPPTLIMPPDHTKLSFPWVQFQLWNCSGLCLHMDVVVPPLFTLLQPEVSTDGVISGRCDRSLMLRSHRTFFPSVQFELWNCWGLCSYIDVVVPPLFTLLRPEVSTDGVKSDRCDQPLTPALHHHHWFEVCHQCLTYQ